MENAEAAKEQDVAPKTNKNSSKKRKQKALSNYFRCFFDADFLIFKGFCFFLYGAYGGLIPYLSLYFKQLSLGAGYAGLIVGIRPLIQCVGAPFWGVLADRYRAGKIIFIASILIWIAKAFALLAVRPHNQHCVELYKNTSSNQSYLYAYDLWDPAGAEQEIRWAILPLDRPVIIQENKITVVDTTEEEKPTVDAAPGEGVFDGGVTDVQAKVTSARGSHHKKTKKRTPAKDRGNKPVNSSSTEQEDLELNKKSVQKKPHEVPVAPHQDLLSQSLDLKITNIVEVYSEKLKATVSFLTSIDKVEVDFMFSLFMLIIIIGEFLESPTYALSDASLLKRLGDDKEYYGRIRLWGSLGWAVAAAMVGLLINASEFKLCEVPQNNYIIAFYLFVGFVAGAFVNALWFRFTYEDEKNFEDIGKVASLLLSLRNASFLVATLYTGFCYGILVHFVNWFVDDLGGSGAIMGAAGAARELSAMIMFAFSAAAIRAMGNVNTMVFCLMSYIVCFLCYSILDDPWMAVALEVLDGGTYGLLWSNCVNYMGTVGAQLDLIETTQGILQGIFWGLGNGGGSMISGALIEMFGAPNTFRAFAIAGAVVMLFLVLAQYMASLLEERNKEREEYELVSNSDKSKGEEATEDSSTGDSSTE